jgi:hypothetical protein
LIGSKETDEVSRRKTSVFTGSGAAPRHFVSGAPRDLTLSAALSADEPVSKGTAVKIIYPNQLQTTMKVRACHF